MDVQEIPFLQNIASTLVPGMFASSTFRSGACSDAHIVDGAVGIGSVIGRHQAEINPLPNPFLQ